MFLPSAQLGEIIKRIREAHGLSGKAFDIAIGGTGDANKISRWEKGKVRPDLDALGSIADFHGVSVDVFTDRPSAAKGGEWGGWEQYPDSKGQQLLRAFRYLARKNAIRAFKGRVGYADLAAALRGLADEEGLADDADIQTYLSTLLRLHAEEGEQDATAGKRRETRGSRSESR